MSKIMRIETHKIKSNHKAYRTLVNLSHLANNLYNQANYLVRQNFIFNNKYLNYYDLDKLFRKHKDLQANWKHLPSHTRQQILKLLDQNWKSYFAANRDYNKNKSKYLGRPKLPNYRKSGNQFLLILTNQEFRLKSDGYIYLAKKYDRLKLKPLHDNVKYKQIRLIPKYDHFKVELIYEKEIEDNQSLNQNKYAAIDLGLNNLATLITNFNSRPIIYSGKKLKSINQYHNFKHLNILSELNLKQNHIKPHNRLKKVKTALEMKQIYENDKELFDKIVNTNQNDIRRTSKRIKQNWLKQENKINDELHKISRYIINYCVQHNIKTIVIGHNKNQKQKSKLKHFVKLPIFRLITFLKYKAEEYGIKIIEINESYTSGTSFLDSELPNKKNYDKNRRLKRGLFLNGHSLINADVNAAYQILRKYNKDINIKYSNKIFNPIIHKVC